MSIVFPRVTTKKKTKKNTEKEQNKNCTLEKINNKRRQ